MTFNVRTVDLGKLNSLTKYPSILTYHQLDPANGGLVEAPTRFSGPVLGTEKVDGTNARIIFLPDGSYLIGSREELLYARGDLIGNPSLGIVEALRPHAERLCDAVTSPDAVLVYYGELYGGKVTGASKQYSGERQVGYRLFDIARLDDYAELLARDQGAISAWREHGGQRFLDEQALQRLASEAGLELTPRLFTLADGELPESIEETARFLRERLPRTLCALDAAAGGQPEGIVVRSADRSQIAKLRFEDYERTLRRRKR